MSKIKNENFVNIQGWMINELKLKGNELFVYAIIYGFTQDGEQWFEGSRQYLADWCNSTKRGIQKNLDSLVEKTFLIKEDFMVNNVKFCKYKVNFDCAIGDSTTQSTPSEQSSPVRNKAQFTTSEQSSPHQGTKFTTQVNKVHSRASDYINNNNNNKFNINTHARAREENKKEKNVPLSENTYIRTIKSERYNSSGRKVCQPPSYDLEDYEQNDDFYEMLSRRR